MNKKIHTEEVREFFKALQTLKTEEEYFSFFEDVCTGNEVLTIAQRYYVAKLLKEGRTYQEIADLSGASSATISRVKRSMDDGSGEGYEIVFGRLESDK